MNHSNVSRERVEDIEKAVPEHDEHPITILKDDVVAAAGDYSGFTQKTDPKEIKLVRKLDLRIMTALWLMYWLNYLDRNAIALAKINTITKDLGLNDVQYQTGVSILFVGYVLTGIPSNMLLTRVRPSVFLCGIMVLWSIISIATAFSRNFTGLVLTRFFLGVVEAPFYPGALLIISNFYTRTEIATRIAILYTGNILATAFAGLIAVPIFKLHGVNGLSGWQYLFIIQGAVTGLVAMLCYPLMPDTPLTTRWLTEEERALASSRLLRDRVDTSEPGSTMQGLKQAVSDYRVWLFCLAQCFHIGANGFKNFFPSVIATLGFDEVLTLVLTCPPYLVAGAFTLFLSWSSGKYNERTWHITAAKVFATLGFVLAPATLNTPVRYIAMCIFTIGTYAVNSLILGWAATVCSQTQEKKAVTLAMMTSLGNASFIFTPYLFIETDKPRYTTAMASSAAFSIMVIIIAWTVRVILRKQNRTLAATGAPTKYPY